MSLSHRARIWLSVTAIMVIALAATVVILIERFQPIARDYVISALKERYQSDVTLGNLRISLFPTVRATGENLTLRFGGRTDVPPLVVVDRFTIQAHFIGFFRNPKRIESVKLEGLQIHIPPRSPGAARRPSLAGGNSSAPFVLDEVVADGTILQTLPANPSKEPLTFEISRLRLHTVGKGLPMTFTAQLLNAKPPGLIQSEGHFGPWAAGEPDQTPVSGVYTFRNADLSVFKGISGTLSSDGKYEGRLAAIEVRGTTDVPDFALTLAGNRMHLRTDFQATVDGTNGDTDLHPVRAVLGKSAFEVSGAIERDALERHKEIDLVAKATGARSEDFLRLAMKGGNPPLTGAMRFNTDVKIPPGEVPVIERLQLNGTFGMNGVRFTSPEVEGKIAALSHRASGEPENHDPSVTADFNGRFRLADGILNLPQFEFDVPGAKITLAGTYGLVGGTIDLNGKARLQATVSQMTTGWKRVLLRPADGLFRHDGAGTEIPIGIGGTRGSPSFKLEIGRVLRQK